MKSTAFVSTLLLVLPFVSAQCPLNCHPGSVCETGDADFSFHPVDSNGVPFEFHKDSNKDGWHCECPGGFTGLRCNRRFETCGNGHFCYHGGRCIAGMDEKIAPNQLFCDCAEAEHNGIPYVGKFCEIQGAVQCEDTQIFCTNGGTCKPDVESKAHPCECPAGHRGPHCEFDTGFVPECTLECQNGGECTLGIKDYDTALYSEFWARQDGNFQYCSCPDGYFGLNCETQGQECGDNHCFNGGSCLQTEHSNGDIEFVCDCTTAGDETRSFAGEFCENESTSFCEKSESANGQLFCTNGGTCKEQEHFGCDCPDGFHGPICEFRDQQIKEECELKCENGGTCRSGNKDNKLFQKFGDELSLYNETHRLWEHCVCPEGYFGVQCEHQLEICPGGEQVCLHGATCERVDETGDDPSHKCDCDDGFDGINKYAGKFCQYTSTDICTTNGQPGVGKANFAFCVNNGQCKARVDDNQEHPGCICEEGFVGDHCEFLEESQTSPASSLPQAPKSKGSSGLVAALAIALLALAALISLSVFRKRRFIKEVDGTVPPIPSPEPMQNPNINLKEMDVEATDAGVPAKDLQTVEIL